MDISISVKTQVQSKSVTAKIVKTAVEDMSRKELAQAAKSLFSTVNKRIARLDKSDVISPALNALKQKRTPKFTSGGKDLKALQKEYAEALAFYNLTTSTVTGARNFTNNIKNVVGERIKDEKYVNRLFDTLHTVQGRMPQIFSSGRIGTDDIIQKIEESAENNEERIFSMDAAEREEELNRIVDELIKQTTDELQATIENIIESAARGFVGDLF